MPINDFSNDHFSPLSTSNWQALQITKLFPKQVRMNKYMELQFQVECLQDVAVVNCSGRLVRGAALDEFRRRIEKLERVRVLVLDVSEVDQLDAGGLGSLLLVRRWAMQRNAKRVLSSTLSGRVKVPLAPK
jgi:ABC-type transporter Mla MlaB component